MQDQQREAVREVWRRQCDFPDGFRTDGVAIQEHPAEVDDVWIRVVRLGGSTVVSVPKACRYLDALIGSEDDLTIPDVLISIVGKPDQMLGPAELFYLDSGVTVGLSGGTDELAPSDPRLLRLLHSVDETEASESGLGHVDEKVLAILENDEVIAACGYEVWQPNVAHICLLTHPNHRRAGLGKRVAMNTCQAILDRGLVPQWRSRVGNVESAGLASSIGFELFGRQVSFRMS